MKQIKLEILEANYWEHYKYAKDISYIFSVSHPKRVQMEETLRIMISEINILKQL